MLFLFGAPLPKAAVRHRIANNCRFIPDGTFGDEAALDLGGVDFCAVDGLKMANINSTFRVMCAEVAQSLWCALEANDKAIEEGIELIAHFSITARAECRDSTG